MNVRVSLHYCDFFHIYRFIILLLGTTIVDQSVQIAGERTKSDIPALLGPAPIHRDRRAHLRYNVILRASTEKNSITTLMNGSRPSTLRRLNLSHNLADSAIRNGWKERSVTFKRNYGVHRRKRRSITNDTSGDPSQQMAATTRQPATMGSIRTPKIKTCYNPVVLTDLCWEVIVAVIFGSMGGSLILTIVVYCLCGRPEEGHLI